MALHSSRVVLYQAPTKALAYNWLHCVVFPGRARWGASCTALRWVPRGGRGWQGHSHRWQADKPSHGPTGLFLCHHLASAMDGLMDGAPRLGMSCSHRAQGDGCKPMSGSCNAEPKPDGCAGLVETSGPGLGKGAGHPVMSADLAPRSLGGSVGSSPRTRPGGDRGQ